MKFWKKIGLCLVLAAATAVTPGIEPLVGARMAVQAEAEPSSNETASFTISGKAEKGSDGDYLPFLVVSGYDKAKFQSATVTLQRYENGAWSDVGSKSYSGITGSIKLGSADISSITFDTWYRLKIVCGSDTDYSNVASIAKPASSESSSSKGNDSDSGKSTSTDSSDKSSQETVKVDPEKCDHSGNTNKKQVLGCVDYDEKTCTMKYSFKCSVCGKGVDEEIKEKHQFQGKPKENGDLQHYRHCKRCDKDISFKHNFKVVKAKCLSSKWDITYAKEGHSATYKCKDCGYVKKETNEEHTSKTKCSVCGWNNTKPGAVTGIQASVASSSSQSKSFKATTRWNDYTHKWETSRATSGTFKVLKVKVSFKAPKGGYKYVINKRPGSGTTKSDQWTTTKTSNTYEMWFTGGTRSCTISITPYSKYGIKGKTVKKTIRI